MLTTLSFETFRLHTNIVLSINFSPDGQKITSSSQDSTIHNWGTLCRPGYYGAHLECQPCAPRSQSKADMDSCLPCTAGTYSVADVSECDTYSTGPSNHRKGKQTVTHVQLGDTVPIMPQLIHLTVGLLRVQLERSAPWQEISPGPPAFSALQVNPSIVCR